MPTVAELPDDVDMLKAMVLATDEQRAAMEADNRRIASAIAALKLINTTSDRSRNCAAADQYPSGFSLCHFQ